MMTYQLPNFEARELELQRLKTQNTSKNAMKDK